MRILLALALVSTSACAPRAINMKPPAAAEPAPFRDVTGGLLLTAGAEIAAEDGSFRIVSNSQFQTPFHQNNRCLINPTAEAPGLGEISGARRVRVAVPGRTEPLYGLLSLCGAPANAAGATANRYTLEVPQSYVAETSGGRVSVVFESHRDAANSDLDTKSWILWLSAAPFPQPNTAETPVTARTEAMKGPNIPYSLDRSRAGLLAMDHARQKTAAYMILPFTGFFALVTVMATSLDITPLVYFGGAVTGVGLLTGGIFLLKARNSNSKIEKLEKKYSSSNIDLIPYADRGGGGLLLSGSF